MGERRSESVALRALGTALHLAGKLDDAAAPLEEAEHLAKEIGEPRLEGFAAAHLGAALARSGRVEAAEAAFARARPLLAAGGDAALDAGARVLELFLEPPPRRAELLRASMNEGESPRLHHERIARALLVLLADAARGPLLEVGPGASWFRCASAAARGERVDVEKNRAARRVLERLVAARVAAPGEAVPLAALLAAGWPRERVRPEAGQARVYTTIRTLRRLGLGELLLTRPDGYLLDPALTVELAAS